MRLKPWRCPYCGLKDERPKPIIQHIIDSHAEEVDSYSMAGYTAALECEPGDEVSAFQRNLVERGQDAIDMRKQQERPA